MAWLPTRARRSIALLARVFGRDRRGNIAVMGAVVAMPLAVLAGGASDYARGIQLRSELQNAIDGATLAGAKASMSASAGRNAFHMTSYPGLVVGQPTFQRVDGADGAGFRGEVRASSSTAFLGLVGIGSFDLHVRSTAGFAKGPSDACLTLLDPLFGSTFIGGAVDAPLCRFQIASTATPAALFNGVTLTTKQLCVAGATVSPLGGSVPNLVRSCAIDASLPARPPVPPEADDACLRTNHAPLPNAILQPGVYCGNTVLTGGATLNPGLYVIRGGALSVVGGLNAPGVTLYFADHSTLSITSASAVTLTAPTAGTYKGVLIYEAAGLPRTAVSIVKSGTLSLKGYIYMPSRNVSISSSGGVATDEINMVFNRLSLTSSGTWRMKPSPNVTVTSNTPYLRS